MAKKKDTSIQISQEEHEQVQNILQSYRKDAENLRKTTDRQQVEAALTAINALSEAAQMTLLAALTKENNSDAAVILLAIHQFGALKAVRKEAKRALIRLEGARVYPRWQPPTEQLLPILEDAVETGPIRFWKGLVTDTFESGEVHLMLSWEQGADYKQARMMGFLLDFWGGGVKDFFTEVGSKRRIEDRIEQMRAITRNLNLTECSLGRGRSLIEDALAINRKHGTRPHRDYRLNESLVKQLVLEAAGADEDDEDDSDYITPGLEPAEVVTTFIEALFDSSYNFAYDLLSNDSALRDGLSRADWVARHEEWEQAAAPENLLPGFSLERKQQSSSLWLPNPFGKRADTARKEVEVSWSLELNETPLSEGLKELPTPTAVYPETKRHWFWASYVLVQDEDEWRIQDIIDEGSRARQLSIDELQKRIDEQDKEIEKILNTHSPTDPDAEKRLLTVMENARRILNYCDILIEKLPLDRQPYEEAGAASLITRDYERALVYLEPLARRFAEGRAEALRQLAAAQWNLAEEYYEEGDDERGEQFEAMAEATLRESLTLEDHYLARIALADILTEKDFAEDEDEDEALDEAAAHLRHAQTLVTDTKILVELEHRLADLAEEREQDDEAIQHYRRMAELQPDDADPWIHLGNIYTELDNFEEAETSYQRALEVDPRAIEAYNGLAMLYTHNDEGAKAIELVEEGMRTNPDSADMWALAAVALAANGNYPRAKVLLEEAERMNPQMEMLPAFHTIVDSYKPQPSLPAKSGQQHLGKHKGKKRRK